MLRFILLMFTLTAVSTAYAEGPIPTFYTGAGKSYNMEVSPDQSNPTRLRIWITEWQRLNTSFTMQMKKAGFEVGYGDTIEFLIPVKACTFRNTFFINCDSRVLDRAGQAMMEMAVYQSGTSEGPILRFNGKDLDENSFHVSFYTFITENSAMSLKGEITSERSMGFESNVWLYKSNTINGWFGHYIVGLQL